MVWGKREREREVKMRNNKCFGLQPIFFLMILERERERLIEDLKCNDGNVYNIYKRTGVIWCLENRNIC